MAMEKGLYAAPQGIAGIDNSEEPDLEIMIEDPEAVEIDANGEPILRIEKAEEEEDGFDDNLAEYISEGQLQMLASDLMGEYDEDVSSRKDWMQTYVDGLQLLGMNIEERSEPWEGACGVYHPLLAETLVKFQAETIMEIFPAAGPVKTQIIGKETQEKKEAATRVQDDMNFRLTDEMEEYRPETERMLWGLGLSGNAFKKVYFDPSLNRQVSMFVPAEDLVVPYGASSLESAPRVTHVMRKTENEVRKLQVAGFWLDIDLPTPADTFDEVEKKIAEKMGFRASVDSRYKILEIMTNLDLEGYEDVDEDGEPTGIALPYIVTIEKSTGTVLSIRRNWRPEDDLKKARSHFVHYGYIPGFGFYCFGLIHLIGAFAKSGTSILRQLVDAGSLANLPGGFKTRGLRVKGDDTPIAPGEFRDVDVPSGTMRDNIMPLPYKEPSQVLAGLLDKIIEEGRGFAGSADLQVSDMSAQAPVGTTLAILERTLKVMSAVQARIHYSLKKELCLLRDIIRDYTPEEYEYEPTEGSRKAKKSDYDLVEVIPVSDPNAATMSQKVVQYQAVMQLAQQAPQLYNLPYLHRQMLEVLGIKNAAKLVQLPDDHKPEDPITENQNILMGKPVKAFLYQDHPSHIMVHKAAMQDPKIAQLIGQNPQAQTLMAAMTAHINEHIAYEYRKQMEAQMGVELPFHPDDAPEDQGMPPAMEVRISQLAAQASQIILNQNKTAIAAQQAQQAQQDPIVQMQQQELAIKKQEAETKQKKVITDAAAKADQIEIEKQRIASQERIAGMQIGAKVQGDKANLVAKQQTEGIKIAVDVAKSKDQIATQQRQANLQHTQSLTQTASQMHNAQLQAESQRKAQEAQAEAQTRNQTPKGKE